MDVVMGAGGGGVGILWSVAVVIVETRGVLGVLGVLVIVERERRGVVGVVGVVGMNGCFMVEEGA